LNNGFDFDVLGNLSCLGFPGTFFSDGGSTIPVVPVSDFTERRKLLEGYTHKWSKAVTIVKSTQEIPPEQSSGWGNPRYLGNGHLASGSVKLCGLAFLHTLPIAIGKPLEG